MRIAVSNVRHEIRRVVGLLQRALTSAVLLMLLPAFLGVPGADQAAALEAIAVTPNQDRVEITTRGELYEDRGDSLQVETAAGRDGIVGRMSVRAATSDSSPNWIVFALTNPGEERIERWLTAGRYSIVGSGAVWPDLDAQRITGVTPSVGFVPERVDSDRDDIFRITLEPGQTITFVAELSSERYSRIYLWKPLAYELKIRERRLFNGIMLGLTGLLAIFLTAIFAANHKLIFPTAALVAWTVLTYLCVDFGFFHKLFNLRPEDNAVYRAAGEASIAASLVIFLHTFLRLRLGHSIVRMLFGVWMLAQLALIAIAVVDPRLAATFARLSFFLIGGVGAVLVFYLALKGQDRALALIPTWLLFLVWIFAAAVIMTGRLSGDVAVAGLVAGLVLIVVLVGFTVTQFAFGSYEPAFGATPNEQQLRVLAVDGAGAATWEWNERRNEIKVGNLVEATLGLNSGELSCGVDDFVEHVHGGDRDKFRLMLWSIQERGGGAIRTDFRLRHSDNTYRWFELEASSIETSDRRSVRVVGLLRNITDLKLSKDRLLQDAVNCSLTGLPNRELFLDRVSVALLRAKTETELRPTIIFIDIDKFRSVNTSFGLVVGDSLLLTVARRLERHLGEHDTLARIGGDQFAILLLREVEARDLAGLAERIRRSLRTPIKIAGRKVGLTGSIGISVFKGSESNHHDLLKEAEIAMYRAKRSGADRTEIFRPEMRSDKDDNASLESDLRTAIEKNQLRVMFQPIVYLPTEELAGFEALVRWQHPTRGLLGPDTFIPVAEQSDLISKLGTFVLARSAEAVHKWQKVLPRDETPLFVSVNISSRQLLRPELVQDVRQSIGRAVLPRHSLRIEVTESLVMENPEQSIEMLEQLRSAGAELALDDFGTGYSSLAYLQRFPFDTIKIDRSFLQSDGDDGEAGATIVRSVVALSHELGKTVVAEGVERPEDIGFLRSIGCEYAQGFYYGEPMPMKEVVELLRIVRKSERVLDSRSLFRRKPKKKPKTDRADTAGLREQAVQGEQPPLHDTPIPGGADRPAGEIAAGGLPTNGALPPPAPLPEQLPPPRNITALPNSTVRPLPRPVRPLAERLAVGNGNLPAAPPVPPPTAGSGPPLIGKPSPDRSPPPQPHQPPQMPLQDVVPPPVRTTPPPQIEGPVSGMPPLPDSLVGMAGSSDAQPMGGEPGPNGVVGPPADGEYPPRVTDGPPSSIPFGADTDPAAMSGYDHNSNGHLNDEDASGRRPSAINPEEFANLPPGIAASLAKLAGSGRPRRVRPRVMEGTDDGSQGGAAGIKRRG